MNASATTIDLNENENIEKAGIPKGVKSGAGRGWAYVADHLVVSSRTDEVSYIIAPSVGSDDAWVPTDQIRGMHGITMAGL